MAEKLKIPSVEDVDKISVCPPYCPLLGFAYMEINGDVVDMPYCIDIDKCQSEKEELNGKDKSKFSRE